MSNSSLQSIDEYPDLSSVPPHRRLQPNMLVEHIRKAVPFNHIAISGLDLEGYYFGLGQSIDTDLPPAYIDTYFAENIGFQDPLVRIGQSRAAPLSENEAYEIEPPPERLDYLQRLFGIRNRLLVPLQREDKVYGAVCFNNEYAFTDSERAFLAFVSEPLHRAITKPLMDRFAATASRLTSGELECLALASKGLTGEQIAARSKYQTETVNTYLKNATRKLGAANRAHAVAEAIRRRFIA